MASQWYVIKFSTGSSGISYHGWCQESLSKSDVSCFITDLVEHGQSSFLQGPHIQLIVQGSMAGPKLASGNTSQATPVKLLQTFSIPLCHVAHHYCTVFQDWQHEGIEDCLETSPTYFP